QITCHLALQQRGASDQRYAEFACRFHNCFVVSGDGLISKRQRLGHSQVEGKLNEAESMIRSCNVARELLDFRQLHGVACARFLAKAVPGRHSIELNLSSGGRRLEIAKCVAHALEKVRARNFGKLRLGIVEVVDVDTVDAEVLQAALELIL